MSDIVLPNKWLARPHQQSLFRYMFDGGSMQRKRALQVWHRRAGKDSCSLQLGAIASQQRVGTIWHMLPTQKQGRKVIWDGIDKAGRRMIDQAFPKDMRLSENNSEMQIRMKNGSIWQVVGSDNYDSLVGANPVGVIFSEYSVANPAAWDFIRPILAENGGWAIFIYTPRGKNHGHRLYQMACKNDNWFSSILNVEQTFDREGTPLIGPDIIQQERDEGMSEEKVLQEYYCSFDAGMEGAYYTIVLNEAMEQGRIGKYPHDPSKQVYTFWDIGIRDNASIIFAQEGLDGHPVIIDHLTDRNKSIEHWIRDVRSLPYNYAEHWGPHDLEQREQSTGKTRKEFAEGLNFNFEIVPNIPVTDGIDATRAMLKVVKIDETKCHQLIDSLFAYRREFDEKANIFRDKPVHDWSSHSADSKRYLAVAWENCAKSRVWTRGKKEQFKHDHRVITARGGNSGRKNMQRMPRVKRA